MSPMLKDKTLAINFNVPESVKEESPINGERFNELLRQLSDFFNKAQLELEKVKDDLAQLRIKNSEIVEENTTLKKMLSKLENMMQSEDEILREDFARVERNQIALNLFWGWADKPKPMIGMLYEQYIGYVYEQAGWKVNYFGISKNYSDLGRDLVCHKDNTTLIIQCKNWSKKKVIRENSVNQLSGTVAEYKMQHPSEKVRGVLYTSTCLSDTARSFAKNLKIKIHENTPLKWFPMIKCHVGNKGEKIYHLPFDQMYFRTTINPENGDFYCETVAEADAAGFRRAYKWHGK